MAKAIHNRNLMHRVELSKEPGGVIAIGEDGNHFFVNDMAKRLLKGIPWQKRFFKVHGKGKNPRSPKAGLRGNPMLPT